MLAHVMLSLTASSYLFIFYGLIVVVHQRPWWDAQYFIPIMGMLLGNTISGISIGLATILEEVSTGVISGGLSRVVCFPDNARFSDDVFPEQP